MSGRVLVEANLRGISDHALISALDALLVERGLPPMVVGDPAEALKAADQHDDGPEEFAENYLAEASRAFVGDFSDFIDRILGRVTGMYLRGELATPLDLTRRDDVTLRSVLDEEVHTFLAEIGFPDAAAAVGERLAAKAPWLPNAIEQAFRLGIVSDGVPEAAPWDRAWRVAQARPLTPTDRAAISRATLRAGCYLRPVAYRVRDDVQRRLLAADIEITRRRTRVGLRARIHPGRLAGHMADLTGYKVDRGDGRMIWKGGSWARDWLRVARTEMADASAHGHLLAHLQRQPDNVEAEPGQALRVPRQLCFKIPQTVRRDARGRLQAPCKHCHRIWYWDDSTPRLYPLEEVMANGSNAGPPPRKSGAWVATVGPTHPNDLCGRLNFYVRGSESLYPGFHAQLQRFRGQGFEGVD